MNDLTCPPQGFFCGPFDSLDLMNCYTACFRQTATTDRERKKNKHDMENDDLQNGRTEYWLVCWIWCKRLKLRLWFLWFVKAAELRIAHSVSFFPTSNNVTVKKALSSQRSGEFKQALSRKSRCSRIKEGLHSLIYRKRERNGADHKICATLSSQDELWATGQASKVQAGKQSCSVVF